MKQVKMLVPAVAGGKPRRKGDIVTLTDMKAAELIGMKICTEVGAAAPVKLQPWDRPRPAALAAEPAREQPKGQKAGATAGAR